MINSERIKILESALVDAHQSNRNLHSNIVQNKDAFANELRFTLDLLKDRDSEIDLLKSQNKSANEALLAVANQLGFQQFSDDEVAIAIENLSTNPLYDQELLAENKKLYSCIEERDRKIATLEGNLDRARSEHLGQLRAIAQMLEPLATHEDKGSIYYSHFGKAAMVTLIQAVICANIKRLDPLLNDGSYDEGL